MASNGAAASGMGGARKPETKLAGPPPDAPDAPAAQRNRRSQTPPGAHDSLNGKRVLIVDDDMRNAFAITSILELYGMTVLHAPDGRTGIEMLRANPGVDIVLMDVMMPGQDGYTTTGAIRKIPELSGLPVIAVTARAMHGDRDKSLAAGATDYITKPVDTEELLSCMERWVRVPGASET
jgi:CheY-like chemotaxis protein